MELKIKDGLMEKLYEYAVCAFELGEIPVSAAVIDSEGNIISIASNKRQSNCSVIDHAEIMAIVEAERKLGDWRLDSYYLISSLEPCSMCRAVIRESRINKVFYLNDSLSGNDNNVDNEDVINKLNGYDLYESKFRNLLKDFFANMR